MINVEKVAPGHTTLERADGKRFSVVSILANDDIRIQGTRNSETQTVSPNDTRFNVVNIWTGSTEQ